jgi:hypothetical protein
VDPSAALRLAPWSYVSSSTAHVCVDLVCGGGLLTAAVVTGGLALAAWSRARRLGAEVWKRRGLRPGPILLPGVARALDDGHGEAAFVELTLEQRGRQWQAKGGPQVTWKEISRKLKQRPFELECENGEHVRVEPGARVELVDRLDVTEAIIPGLRRRTARITPGEPIWVRGDLYDNGKASEGPYREAAPSHRWVLRPHARDAMYISSEPVDAEERAAGKLDLKFALVYVLLLVGARLLFADYLALRAAGVETQARVVQRNSYWVRGKHGNDPRYSLDVELDVGGRSQKLWEPTNGAAYRQIEEGAMVPVTYLPTRPTVVQLATRSDLSTDMGGVFIAYFVIVTIGLLHIGIRIGRRPWWRQKKVVEIVPGRLT